MTIDPNSPRVLAAFPTEAQAALVANHLNEQGIRALVAGSEPGTAWPDTRSDVQVVVRQADLTRAAELLEEVRAGADQDDMDELDEE